jgi:agmatine/peptidylarginine deiminase
VIYPPLWTLYAALCEAIAPVAEVVITVPRPTWASGIRLYLQQHGFAHLDRLRFLYLPTDDIWVRDYGPFVGLKGGERVAVTGIYHPLPQYPQQADQAMALRWAAHQDMAARAMPLYAEGGNLLSDGAGTLIMSDRFERRDTPVSEEELHQILHRAFDFDKLIITPHLDEEDTGHVDLLLKLADAQTVFVTEPGESINLEKFVQTLGLFQHETNARGIPYRVHQLPFLPPYYNWGIYPIWRTYTNALTVNGRVLVPVYGEKSDAQALAVYAAALPHYEIIPIDCKVVINGGGAVHCLTKEIPQARSS